MVHRLWKTSPQLIATAVVMLLVLAGAVVGVLVDPREIAGAPAWLKPCKFAVSIAIYTVTLAWIFTVIPEWTRTTRVVGWATVIVMMLEMAIIGTQAWRGTTSHFNVGTTRDATLFGIMGAAILLQTLSSIGVAVALWRHRFDDLALGWALRIGMCLTIAGALTGGLMTRPTSAQLDAARAGARMTIAGAHTVGGADGGPGLVGTGWSIDHGDLRVPHFVGLHAVQMLPLLALLPGRWPMARHVRVRFVIVGSVSYAVLFVMLLIEAIRGVSVVAPESVNAASVWFVATVSALVMAAFSATRRAHATAL